MLSKNPHLRAHFLSRQAKLPGVNNHDDCRSKTVFGLANNAISAI
ncbi:unnamed protein product [Ectocarpus fasciculatus]